MEFLILSSDEELITTIDEELLIGAQQQEGINNAHTLTFQVIGNHDKAIHVKEGNLVAFEDIEGDFQLYEIVLITDIHGDGSTKEALCEHANVELLDEHIEDVRPTNETAASALTQALEGTRWQPGVVAELGLGSTNFYREDPKSAIKKIIGVWGGEVRYRITMADNVITGRYVDLLARRGADRGKTYEHGKDLVEVTRSIDITAIKTAVRGYGKGEEIGEGYSRRITFKDIEWSVANGDPMDKPAGQDWLGDEDARDIWGRPEPDGTKRHRFGQFEDSAEEDPEQLLKNAYAYLLSVNKPIPNYDGKVVDLFRQKGKDYAHERAILGDTAAVLDDEIAPSIEEKARIIELRRDLLNAANDEAILGQYLPLYSDQDTEIDKIVAKVKDNSGVWDNPDLEIRPDKYPDIKPSQPVVTANGAFETVQLFWDYAYGEYYTQAFEVYASEVQGFTTDPANLVFRGLINGYNFIGETNKQYYFRVRAINFQGTPSDFSEEVSATTARIISTDILFGPEIAEELRQLSVSAQMIADGALGIEALKEGAMVGDVFLTDGRTYISEAAVGTAAIANAAITRAHLQDAIIGTAQIEDATITNAKVKDISADKLTFGTARGIELEAVTITGSVFYSERDADNYARIEGPTFESRGTYTRTWRDTTETHNTVIRLENGYFRMRNDSENRSIYGSDFGFSTYVDGDGQEASGTISFFNTDYSVPRGISVHSGNGAVSLVSNANRIVLDANATVNIESEQSSIYLRPMKLGRAGHNEFRAWIKDGPDASETDGVFTFGNTDVGQASGLRFKKSTVGEPVVYATNGNGDVGSGSFMANYFYGDLVTRFSYAYVRAERTRFVQGFADNQNYSEIQFSDALCNSIRYHGAGDFYIGVSTYELRITNNLRWNNGDPGYKNVRAASFITASSEEYKEDITEWNYDALSVIMYEWQPYQYKFKGDIQNIYHRGSIVERKTPVEFIAGKGIDNYEMNTWALRAIQQIGLEILDIKVREGQELWFTIDEHEQRILDLENEKQQLKERVAALEAA